MQLTTVNKEVNKSIVDNMILKSISHPHFMLYCPEKFRRADYIKNYFTYYLKKYEAEGGIYTSESGGTVALLLPIEDYCKKVNGSFAMSLKVSSLDKRFMSHKMVVGGIIEILVPQGVNVKVLNLFGDSSADCGAMMQIVKEIIASADKENFAVVYETLSRRLVLTMEAMGFEIGYQKQYLGSQYTQTVMTYNIVQR